MTVLWTDFFPFFAVTGPTVLDERWATDFDWVGGEGNHSRTPT